MTQAAILVLEDGTVFRGTALGAAGTTVGEVVFNTAITGYQEILSDPSYARQIVTLTYPHIGNTGVTTVDAESRATFAAGLVIRDLPLLVSNWRSQMDLDTYLRNQEMVAIADIDTRALTRLIREKGAQSGCISTGSGLDVEDALAQARAFGGLQGLDLAKEVSTAEPYEWREGVWELESNSHPSPPANEFKVVAYDFGLKHNISRLLVERGCKLEIVPAQTPADVVLAREPDGVFLSNGPGDPEPCSYAIESIAQILENRTPMFGICLGHQLLALACGAKTTKMKFGHHGANHPVKDLASGAVLITSQNHGFAVDEESLPANVEATHRSLFDGTLQGIRLRDRAAFGFQGHPEASPGPHDIQNLFDEFIAAMRAEQETA
ncbi:MAG: glutamine-hydrolyzing carbamoyl-phosphate synthase small subunit [Pseudomonadota bacterium]